ncbi:MAG: hypothetical protein HY290_16835 [Planctomycetia bacterium]|nr:hypothetical protein [Planctomycetia bacterium]
MDPHDINRRDFHRLTMAALGGALTGTVVGCGDDKPAAPAKSGAGTPSQPATDAKSASRADTEVAQADVKGEPHACSGLNACKNQGASGKNDCAGQGDCATKSWHHTCGGHNACKGQGGCGETATINDCKGTGGCHIPLMGSAWKSARKHFEERMKEAEKEFGEGSPPKLKKAF